MLKNNLMPSISEDSLQSGHAPRNYMLEGRAINPDSYATSWKSQESKSKENKESLIMSLVLSKRTTLNLKISS